MDFRVLGPLEMLDKGQNVAPTAPKPRQVIALLIMRRNAVVQTAELIDELWEGGPPVSALTTLQTYVYKLRKILMRHGGKELLHTRPGGYLLEIPNTSIDLHRVEHAVSEGQASLETGNPARAREILAEALSIWRAPALVDVDQGGLLSSYATRLEEFRSRTLELRIEADLRLGHHRELVSELKSLVLTHPLHEHLHASLMIALHRSGRRHEALEVFRLLRHNMIEDLGLEPGEELRQLHQALLADAPVGPPFQAPQVTRLAPPPGGASASVEEARDSLGDGAWRSAAGRTVPPETHSRTPRTPAGAATPPVPADSRVASPATVPAELPADVVDFTGRTLLIERIGAHLTPAEPHGTASRVAVIAGMPGVGKTALATHLAHRLRHRFQDGQLHVELAGSSGAPRDIREVLDEVLHSLGVQDALIPESLEERSKLLRSTTASRRLLLVLDDASSPADVRPLLPGGAQCAVILTSRRRLHGLAGAQNVDLEVLEGPEGLDLLASLIGRQRLEKEPEAAERLVALGGALPLALRCIGGRLAAMPGLPLTRVADQLARSRDILAELRLGDLDVKAGFDAMYGRLTRSDQAAFRLLSMLPADAFTAGAAAELLGRELPVVERVLNRFVNSFLIRIVRYDHGDVHFAYPPLTWKYARSRLDSTLAVPTRSGPGEQRGRLANRGEHARPDPVDNDANQGCGHVTVS
ncbi:BTAD domain-containing putative transcriptional regulator [Streptomyces wuyuanensis]|uniref:AfsR/SARP family transcriptional regulator n=2 Tax=Streptomyces wuyuanensis TaxID=1196353 RepID=UPI003720D778